MLGHDAGSRASGTIPRETAHLLPPPVGVDRVRRVRRGHGEAGEPVGGAGPGEPDGERGVADTDLAPGDGAEVAAGGVLDAYGETNGTPLTLRS